MTAWLDNARATVSLWSLKKQMTVLFVTVAAVAVLVIVALAMGNQAVMSQNAEDVATKKLEDRMAEALTATVEASALTIAAKLLGVQDGVVDVIKLSIQRVVNTRSVVPAYALDENAIVRATVVNPDELAVNAEHMSVYVRGTTDDVATGETATELELLSRLEPIVVGAHQSSDLTLATYFATDKYDLFLYTPAAPRARSYVPRERPWYQAAEQRSGPVYGAPYVDFSGHGIVITLSEMVPVAGDSEYVVVAADIQVQTILDQVLNVNFLKCDEGKVGCEEGYAALYMQGGSHLVVAHPAPGAMCAAEDPDCEPKPIDDIETDVDVDWDAVSGSLTTVETNGRMLVFAPVLDVFTMMASVPMSRLHEPVDDLEASMDKTRDSVVIVVVIVSIVTIAVTVTLIFYLAKRLADRMAIVKTGADRSMKNMVQGRPLTEGVDDHVGGDVVQDEINAMVEAFTRMVRAVAAQQMVERFLTNPFFGAGRVEELSRE